MNKKAIEGATSNNLYYIARWLKNHKLDINQKESWTKALKFFRDTGFLSTARTCLEQIQTRFGDC